MSSDAKRTQMRRDAVASERRLRREVAGLHQAVVLLDKNMQATASSVAVHTDSEDATLATSMSLLVKAAGFSSDDTKLLANLLLKHDAVHFKDELFFF